MAPLSRHSIRHLSERSLCRDHLAGSGYLMRGRRPKPTRIKALTGNPGKRPLNAHEPRPEPALPECPPELSPAAQREWARLTGELSKLSLITNLDRGALATFGQSRFGSGLMRV